MPSLLALVTSLILVLAGSPASAAAASEEVHVELSVAHLYHGMHRPVVGRLEVRGASAARVELILLDADGAALAGPLSVRPGRFDLLKLMPVVRTLDRAAWLQTLVEGSPSGTPLVVQPMLTRQVPEVEQVALPDGGRTLRIGGWRDELLRRSPDAAGEPAPARDVPVRSGFRIYADRDVILETTEGEIRIALRPDHAPNTAWNFRRLVEGGFYFDIPFHRVVPLDRSGQPFVIQAGDPSGTGSGGPGYWLPIEPSRLPHAFGVISMARDVPVDSAGSQFFLCLSREGTARLDGQYCAFGQTVAGGEVILRIAETELEDVALGRPRNAPVIRAAHLVPAPPRKPGAPRDVVGPPSPPAAEPSPDGRIDR